MNTNPALRQFRDLHEGMVDAFVRKYENSLEKTPDYFAYLMDDDNFVSENIPKNALERFKLYRDEMFYRFSQSYGDCVFTFKRALSTQYSSELLYRLERLQQYRGYI